MSDAANEAIACLLIKRGFVATPDGPGVEVQKGKHIIEDIHKALIDSGIDERPSLDILLADVKNLQQEKWNWALPDDLLRTTYASLYLDIDEALKWITNLG